MVFYCSFIKIFCFFLVIFHGNLIIFIVLQVMLIIILDFIAMIMTITWGWIFNLCFHLFVYRKWTTYFFNLIIIGVFIIYILFLFDLNWIIKWINLNSVNLIIQISEFSFFFNDDDIFMLVISFENTKQINLFRFKIHIFYRTLVLWQEFCTNYYFG